jgi:Na+-translocating ferredoxin:NAD+ oxidoreductase RnfG subunit
MKTFIYILFIICLSSLTKVPDNYLKKINKEIFTVFEIKDFERESVLIDSNVLSEMDASFNPDNFIKIIKDQKHLGYFYFGKAPSKADEFDYMVIFDDQLIIKKIKILAYREDYGGEISSKRWLRQFNGLSKVDQLKYGKDIKGISGATISAVAMTNAVNDLLANLSKLQY